MAEVINQICELVHSVVITHSSKLEPCAQWHVRELMIRFTLEQVSTELVELETLLLMAWVVVPVLS